MAKVNLIAKERFYYAGRNVEMDEEFEAEEIDVPLLTHAVKPMAKVMEAEAKLGRTAKPDSETQGERRTYKRRDMKAED